MTHASAQLAPGLSVVIPCRDGARTLPRQLAALAGQRTDVPWEVVVADNGSTDETAEVAASWSDRLPALTVVDASARPGASHARNVGARAARYSRIVWVDADDEVQPGFLSAVAAGLDAHAFCAGTWTAPGDDERLEALPGPAQGRWGAALADTGFLDAVGACNGLAVRAEALADVPGWAEDMRWGSEDTAFCWDMQLAGHALTHLPEARVVVHPRDQAGALWRQQAAWGTGAVDLYRRFAPRGAPRSSTAGALVRWALLAIAWPVVLVPRLRYRWLGTAARRWGRLRGSLRFRTLYL